MTGLLSPVALFLPGTTHDYAIWQAGPSILSRDRRRETYVLTFSARQLHSPRHGTHGDRPEIAGAVPRRAPVRRLPGLCLRGESHRNARRDERRGPRRAIHASHADLRQLPAADDHPGLGDATC